ncbi:SusC/RagA family TonB-linked outer membrane protein [Bacteroidia bacterium]|nr:SusC/RagA family TonB-linked outer membrane protein [Bacteroidia bacterium]
MKKIVISLILMFPLALWAQDLNVSGRVVDAGGEPVVGASVVVKGTSRGVTTGINGDYDIQAAPDATLVLSFLGMETKEEAVGGRGRIDVVLGENTTDIEEVVVVGYGVMKKSDVTGAVASVKADALKKTPASNITQALQGKAAGVTVNANSGQPGQAATVRIRGIGTLNNSDPIYVVDGIIVSEISFLNANDIASTEILKDASAAAIYGSRGANGVVIITTKKGTEKEGKISFDSYVGVQSRWRKLDVMKSREFAQTMINFNDTKPEIDAFNGGVVDQNKGFNYWLYYWRGVNNKSPYFPVIYDDWQTPQKTPTGFNYAAQETDWQDEVFVENAMVQSYNLSFTGGDDKRQYALSAGYFDQDGTIIGSYYKRLTVRANTSYQIRKWLKVGETMTYMTSTQRNAMHNSGSAGASILSAALAMAPWDPTHYPAGTVNAQGVDISGQPAAASNFKNVTNPFSMVETTHPNDYADRVVGDVYLELTPLKGLSVRSSVSMDLSNTRSRTFKEKYEYSAYDKNEKNFLSSSLTRYHTLIVQNVATYAQTLGKHSFSLMAGQTTEEYNYYNLGNSGSTILNPVESNWYLSQTTADNTNPAGDGVDRTRMLSFLGRLHYTYADKYLFTANFRADGSSKFPENKWGYFPSAALGWRLGQEEFLKDIDILDELKLRVGWGQLGNQSSVGSGDFLQSINSGTYFSSYILGQGTPVVSNGLVTNDGQSLAQGASINTWVNKGGKWEVTEQWNMAADFSLWKRKFSGTIDLFRRDTKEMFLYVSAPAYTGNLFNPKANVGTVRNEGIEISLEHQNNIGEVFYSVGGNVSFIQNKLIALNGGFPLYGDRVVSDEGLALFTYFGYDYLGLYQSDQEATDYLYTTTAGTYKKGDAKYRDLNEDGKINDDDRTQLGNPFPWLSYGINLSAEWKGLDLQVFLQGVYGNEIYNAQRIQLEGTGNGSAMSTAMRNAWTPSTPDGSIPNPRNTVNFHTSSRFIENGAYLRLKNVQLGYTLPKIWTQKVKIDRLRLYVAANNLLTFTGYTGYDPEVGSGVDYGNYPQSRTLMFGCNIDF